MVALEAARRQTAEPGSPVAGADPAALLEACSARRGPKRILDVMLRAGPYGDHFGLESPEAATGESTLNSPEAATGESTVDSLAPRAAGLSLDVLEAAPHGIDLGPLESRLPGVLRTPSGRVELTPEPIVADVERLRGALGRHANGSVVLVGRRQLRSNNSWMHNLEPLMKGKTRCTMHVHPDDAARFGLEEGRLARVTSAAGEVSVPVEITNAVMPGVVSIPHGWGHDADGVEMEVATAHAGTNSNTLADESLVDAVSGNAVLNGIPVEVAPVRATEPAIA